MDSELKTCTNRTNIVFIIPGPIPSLLLLLLLSQLLCGIKGKGSENTAVSRRMQSLKSQALTFKAQRDTRLAAQLGVLLIVIYLFCLLSYDILFSVCIKQDLEKQHNTSPHFFVLFFLPKPGEKKLHFCTIALLTRVIDTVGSETLMTSSFWPLCGRHTDKKKKKKKTLGKAQNPRSVKSSAADWTSPQPGCFFPTSLPKC